MGYFLHEKHGKLLEMVPQPGRSRARCYSHFRGTVPLKLPKRSDLRQLQIPQQYMQQAGDRVMHRFKRRGLCLCLLWLVDD